MALAFAKATVPQEKFTEIGRSGLKHWGGILEDEFLRELHPARTLITGEG